MWHQSTVSLGPAPLRLPFTQENQPRAPPWKLGSVGENMDIWGALQGLMILLEESDLSPLLQYKTINVSPMMLLDLENQKRKLKEDSSFTPK